MNKTTIKFLRFGTLMMALSVILGAFGAHALKDMLDANMLAVYNTGVEYQFYHALGLLVVAFVASHIDTQEVNIAGIIMFASIFIFSGSLYLLTITGIKWFGVVTPIGGTGFVISWVILFISLKDVK
jgi:uncharacterized membrane protein YgdD (TMEM256/DUF423 family)